MRDYFTSSLQLVRQIVRRYDRATNIVAGLAAGSVFSFGMPVWFLPCALIVFIYSFSSQKKHTSLKDYSLLGVCFFVPFHAVVLSWFLEANISGLIGMSRSMALAAAIISWAIMTAVTTLPMLAVIWALRRVDRANAFAAASILAASWVISEWGRSMLFSIFLYGSQGSLGDYWNFGSLGLALMDTPLGVLSRFTGMYGLTFLTVFVAVLVYKSRQKQDFIVVGSVLVTLVFVSITSYKLYESDSTSRQKAASMLQNQETTPNFGYDTPIQSQSSTPKDLIILPEYSHMFDQEYAEFADMYVNSRLGTNGTSINVSDGNHTKWYGTLEFRNNTGQLLTTQTKELLIPTGEYLPYVLTIFYRITDQQKVIDEFNLHRQVYKGSPPQVFAHGDLIVGPVACSGILGRNIYRGLTASGAEVLTNSASLIDFQNSRAYFRQSLQMARFHAVANSRPFIQSSLGAPAFALDHQGKYIVQPDSADTKLIDFTFTPKKQKTPYTVFGEWALVLSAIILFATLFSLRKQQK